MQNLELKQAAADQSSAGESGQPDNASMFDDSRIVHVPGDDFDAAFSLLVKRSGSVVELCHARPPLRLFRPLRYALYCDDMCQDDAAMDPAINQTSADVNILPLREAIDGIEAGAWDSIWVHAETTNVLPQNFWTVLPAKKPKAQIVVRLDAQWQSQASFLASTLPAGWLLLVGQSADHTKKVSVALFWSPREDDSVRVRSECAAFSILMPSYNHAAYLPTALESLIAQDYPHWEAVVVNDGSPDNTAEVAQSYCRKDPRIKYVEQDNGGTAVALNRAVAESSSPWLCWLSSDDYFLPGNLALKAAMIEKHHGRAVLYHTAYYNLDDTSQQLVRVPPAYPNFEDNKVQRLVGFAKRNNVNAISATWPRALLKALGGFEPDHLYTHDFYLWGQMMKQYPSHYLPVTSSVSRVGPAQTTSRNFWHTRFEALWAQMGFVNALSVADFAPDDDTPERFRENLEAAAFELLNAFFCPFSYLKPFSQNAIFVDKAVHLANAVLTTQDDLDAFLTRFYHASIGRGDNAEGRQVLDYFVDRVKRKVRFTPYDILSVVRKFADGADEPETRAGAQKFLERIASSGLSDEDVLYAKFNH